MQKFIKNNYKLLNFLSSILLFALILSCLIGVHNFITGFLGILLCFLSLNLSFYEDLNNTTCRIISTEYKKNGVHSLFSPFSWEKEWNYHYLYFLTVIKKNKIFGLKFIFFYLTVLFPYRIWTNYFIFLFPQTTFIVLLLLSVLFFFFFSGPLKFLPFLLGLFVFFGDCVYFPLLKSFYEYNSFVRKNIDTLCITKEFQYFFLGNPFGSTFLAVKIHSYRVIAGIGGVAFALHHDYNTTQALQKSVLKDIIQTKAQCGLPLDYEGELEQIKTDLKPIITKVLELLKFE